MGEESATFYVANFLGFFDEPREKLATIDLEFDHVDSRQKKLNLNESTFKPRRGLNDEIPFSPLISRLVQPEDIPIEVGLLDGEFIVDVWSREGENQLVGQESLDILSWVYLPVDSEDDGVFIFYRVYRGDDLEGYVVRLQVEFRVFEELEELDLYGGWEKRKRFGFFRGLIEEIDD